ncbi:unnamed protein product [Brassica rapa]|uniref:Uncharacterized protein n=1 Tax=Brassica campestris TaxID=3711 RepID=A0A3P6A9D2_BRACM|nr:unnamed protein product [Brassica rapa]VDC84074.1 unnamed protein product [Brassica rapa]
MQEQQPVAMAEQVLFLLSLSLANILILFSLLQTEKAFLKQPKVFLSMIAIFKALKLALLLSRTELNLIVVCVTFQGTAAVVFELVAAQKVLGKSLADHTFLFLGAGEVRP